MSQNRHTTRATAPRWGSKGDRGSAFVEFALVSPLLLLLMFGVLDFGRLFFTELTIQHALREAGRFAVTGNHLPNPGGGSWPRVYSIKQVAQQSAAGLDLTNIKITSVRGGTNHAGGPSDTVTISLTTSLKLLTPLVADFFPQGASKITASTTFKNEPFDPQSTL